VRYSKNPTPTSTQNAAKRVSSLKPSYVDKTKAIDDVMN